MFGLSFGEILVILAVALIVLGPDRLPGTAKVLGKTLADFRRAMDDIRSDLTMSEPEPPPRRNLTTSPAPSAATPADEGAQVPESGDNGKTSGSSGVS